MSLTITRIHAAQLTYILCLHAKHMHLYTRHTVTYTRTRTRTRALSYSHKHAHVLINMYIHANARAQKHSAHIGLHAHVKSFDHLYSYISQDMYRSVYAFVFAFVRECVCVSERARVFVVYISYIYLKKCLIFKISLPIYVYWFSLYSVLIDNGDYYYYYYY